LSSLFLRIQNRLKRDWHDLRGNLRLIRTGLRVAYQSRPQKEQKPVAIFNASTRLTRVSLNAAYSVLTAWGLQLAGIPVVHFVCKAGMSRCVLGTKREDEKALPPCQVCIAQTNRLLLSAPVVWFRYEKKLELANEIQGMSISELSAFQYPLKVGEDIETMLPLGQLVTPALRWVLRRHHLIDDEPTRFIYREYILSAYHVAREFVKFMDDVDPQCVLLFNGQFFPEATARWIAVRRGIRVITHEVGLRPFTAFFTEGEATAYPLTIPQDFTLSEGQNAQLDEYLAQRFQGQFSMAGIQFWSEMSQPGQDFLNLAAGFEQIVPVFTNVIFDTSQPHSNTIFPHMFAWLEMILEIARRHRKTLFVIRAHPDETRPGKESQESVRQWIEDNQIETLPNILFVDAQQPLSSYDLILRSKFIMIYNSTIGLEASILGKAVLCGGRSRFTQIPTVFFPSSQEKYKEMAEEFLEAKSIEVPAEFQKNARRFLYYQLYYSSLPFSEFLEEDGVWPGFVRLRAIRWKQLLPQNSATMSVIQEGLLRGGDFMWKDHSS
jgi:hypothetical protein